MIYYRVNTMVRTPDGDTKTVQPDTCDTLEEAQGYVNRLNRQHGIERAWVSLHNTDPCRDCDDAKRWAYSDATTPGFFHTTCEKHRLPKRTATIEHHVTDQGNGGANCGDCGKYLGSDPFKIPSVCPKCWADLIPGGMYIQTGGSDF